ncbi:hypothetical protein SEA_ARCHIMEDES_56 [Gordonia phage Archimedes]|uniref:Uncharacterized protein n=1 Tax=Gordonia phage Archimedes TaxID=2759389 RepID=A0A7L7SHN0_9CAUD|nr:hypothetical protein KCH38_gp56 [Gordonia phage Archimedes]QOC55756.1 hypothetical protein SEA_ARCHIMEDES_56 [Gordonia phage Archimedes]
MADRHGISSRSVSIRHSHIGGKKKMALDQTTIDRIRRSEALGLAVKFAHDRGVTTDSHPGTTDILAAAEKFRRFLAGEDQEGAK